MISNKLYQKLSKEAQNVAEYIYNIYHNDDVCIGDILDVLTASDIPDSESLTIEDWHYVYMTLMSYIEGDHFSALSMTMSLRIMKMMIKLNNNGIY